MAVHNQSHATEDHAPRLSVSETAIIDEAMKILKRHARASTLITSWNNLTAYLALSALPERVEVFRVLFLNRKNALIRDKVMARGSIDHAPVYVGEVMRSALLLDAAAIILCHNHPGGDPTPSKSDVEMTKHIQRACEVMNIALHDHIVVGFGREDFAVSMRSTGMI